jgi:hypothetical protein
MAFSNKRAALLIAGALLLAVAACGGNGTVPSSPPAAGNAAQQVYGADSNFASPADDTSILKKLTKDVVIGSTVDPTNGDTGPHAISVVKTNFVLKKGQVVVCNFADKSGSAGKGTTIDVLDPQPSSKPTTFAQSTEAEGCDGDAITSGNGVFAAGFTSGVLAAFSNKGKLGKTYGSPLEEPFSDVDAANPNLYAAEYIFSSDASTGGIVSFSINNYGNNKPLQVGAGFDVNKKSGWSALGPSGLQYDKKHDTLYITDGVDDNVVAFTHASELLVQDEIVVEDGGKSFKCKYPQTTCGKLIFSGSPLKAPVAMALLSNGNLIVANTKGGNTLVEISAAGQVLDTKVVDKSKTAGIFGLAATGSNDNNTALYYTDTNTNTLHKLEQ